MNIIVTQAAFEQAVLAAKSKDSKIFDKLMPYINEQLRILEGSLLGAVGVQAVETDANICQLAIAKASVRAFVDNLRHLDVTLTNTGFGVVSTNDTAPASKQRVDALEGQLRTQYYYLHASLLDALFKCEGWGSQPVARQVDTLYYKIGFLSEFAGVANPKADEWALAVPRIYEAEAIIRKSISDEYFDALTLAMTTNSVTDSDSIVIHKIRQYVGMHLASNPGKAEYFRRLMAYIEINIDSYPVYANSSSYKLNHYSGYENTSDAPAFFFGG